VKAGYGQGRRPELTGRGLICSLGGWTASKKLRLKGQDRLKGDERILGDSDIVTSISQKPAAFGPGDTWRSTAINYKAVKIIVYIGEKNES
jgi:hypothetical protein